MAHIELIIWSKGRTYYKFDISESTLTVLLEILIICHQDCDIQVTSCVST